MREREREKARERERERERDKEREREREKASQVAVHRHAAVSHLRVTAHRHPRRCLPLLQVSYPARRRRRRRQVHPRYDQLAHGSRVVFVFAEVGVCTLCAGCRF